MSVVLNFGSLNIDLTFHVPHIVCPKETLGATSLTRSAGGKGANQSAALGKAGVKVFHAGKLGKDGQFILDKLVSYGVDVGYTKVTDEPSGQAIIQVDAEGQNSIILLGGGNKAITESDIDSTLSHFQQGDWLVLQNEINKIDYLIRQAATKGMRICFNPAPYDAHIQTLPLEKVSLLVVNEIEAQGLAGISTPSMEFLIDSLARKFPDTELILTAGSEGSFYAKGKERYQQGIFKTKVVDTTGAGDTFLGYYLASRLRGYEVPKALATASKASSIAISRPGAMDAIPWAKEVF